MSAAGSWLLEPADPEPVTTVRAAGPRPVIAVFGLAPGCGATVVARALAAELGARDPAGAAAVTCELPGSAWPLATPAATRLARSLADVPRAATRAVGRLCLVAGADALALADCARHFAPLVLDAGSAALGGRSAALADCMVLVASPAPRSRRWPRSPPPASPGSGPSPSSSSTVPRPAAGAGAPR